MSKRRVPRLLFNFINLLSFNHSRGSVDSQDFATPEKEWKDHQSGENRQLSESSSNSDSTGSNISDEIPTVDNDPVSIDSLPASYSHEPSNTMVSHCSLQQPQDPNIETSKDTTEPSTRGISLETISEDRKSTPPFLGVIDRESGIPYTGGATADIYIGNFEDRKVALKALRIFATEKEQNVIFKECFEEAASWKTLEHKNVLQFLGISRESLDRRICLVTPFMENGNIQQYIEQQKDPRPNPWDLMSQVADGLKYLHSKQIIHGDIKAANVLIKDDGQACLSDTGLAAISKTDGFISSRHMSINSTARWMAPELYDEQPILTSHSDIYAFGMTLYEILSGQVPFHQHREFAVINKVLQGERPPRPKGNSPFPISDAVWQLMESCWEASPIDRCLVDQLPSQLQQLSALFGVEVEVLGL